MARGDELVWARGNTAGEARTILGDQHIWDGPVQAGTSQPIKLTQDQVALVSVTHTGGELDNGEIIGYLPTTPI